MNEIGQFPQLMIVKNIIVREIKEIGHPNITKGHHLHREVNEIKPLIDMFKGIIRPLKNM